MVFLPSVSHIGISREKNMIFLYPQERPISQLESQPVVEQEETKNAIHSRLESTQEVEQQQPRSEKEASAAPGVGLVIGSELVNPDPVSSIQLYSV